MNASFDFQSMWAVLKYSETQHFPLHIPFKERLIYRFVKSDFIDETFLLDIYNKSPLGSYPSKSQDLQIKSGTEIGREKRPQG